ncbi:hypothetical protein [Chitiniphilus shinanonensis]|uniref:hypothetical protein n=1 Tax=Chitiniphilus shinanonensis TaxID=553088 RepID=UPI00333E2FE3
MFKKISFLVFVILLLFLTIFYVYTHTRASYQEVGFYSGRLYQKGQMMRRIRDLGKVMDCKKYENVVELVSVKAESICLAKDKNGFLVFCEFPLQESVSPTKK